MNILPECSYPRALLVLGSRFNNCLDMCLIVESAILTVNAQFNIDLELTDIDTIHKALKYAWSIAQNVREGYREQAFADYHAPEHNKSGSTSSSGGARLIRC